MVSVFISEEEYNSNQVLKTLNCYKDYCSAYLLKAKEYHCQKFHAGVKILICYLLSLFVVT